MTDLNRIKELFDIEYGNQLDKNKMIEDPEGINFVSRSSSDLGVNGRVQEIPGVAPYTSGLITVTLGGTYLLSAFVQPRRFYTAQNIKVLTPKRSMSFNQKVYYCLAISSNRFRFTSHGREANKTFDDILIPSPYAVPKWVTEVSLESCTKDCVARDDITLDVGSWREFRLGDVFEIKKGRRLTRANMGEVRWRRKIGQVVKVYSTV